MNYEDVLQELEQEIADRAADMPTEQDAIDAMFRAYQRLKDLGWEDAIHCPKDGTWFHSVEAGSTGIAITAYHGEWPKGGWWHAEAGDLWPGRPVLFKPKEADDDGKPA